MGKHAAPARTTFHLNIGNKFKVVTRHVRVASELDRVRTSGLGKTKWSLRVSTWNLGLLSVLVST